MKATPAHNSSRCFEPSDPPVDTPACLAKPNDLLNAGSSTSPPPLPCSSPPLPASVAREESSSDVETAAESVLPPLVGLSQWISTGRSSAWLASTALHLLLMIVLSLWLFAQPRRGPQLWLQGETTGPLADAAPIDFSLSTEGNQGDGAQDVTARLLGGATIGTVAVSRFDAPKSLDIHAVDPARQLAGFESLARPLAVRGGGLTGRQGANRSRLALGGGGTPESETAVERGLAWLAAHQLPNGSWVFDLEKKCPQCHGYCRNSGTYSSTTASTGLALLCFLGAGYTHEQGQYREVVANGLYYLQEQMALTSRGGDLRDRQTHNDESLPMGIIRAIEVAGAARFDTMYSHGIATLALTEAYAMTRDKSLQEPAQQAVNFIVNAQFDDGGWRYVPAPDSPGPGDMTVTGWQITALKSGLLGGLDIPYEIWERIASFLDGMQGDSASTYLYLRGDRGTKATTAIGLLSRMIGGWPRDARPLQAGLVKLGNERPHANNMYFNFYASQVLHHAGGPRWKKWNPPMRDYLVDSQGRDGHEVGSWYFAEAHSAPGGRLYTTAMAIMTLEVYYRYMPLYQEAFVDTAP